MQNFDQFQSTPGSRIENERRKSLVLRVLAVDPNGGRCLVENSSPKRSIEYCHVVPQRFWRKHALLDSLEWYWGMQKNTLNLETCRNIFPIGSSVRRMYDAGKWILVPEGRIVKIYYDALATDPLRAQRASFPVIPDKNDFQYRLLPLHDLSEIPLIHQNDTTMPLQPSHFTTHLFPFATLPPLVSHIHPKFVIVSAGSQLLNMPIAHFEALAETNPIIRTVLAVFLAWSGYVPDNAPSDPSYYPPYKPGPDGDDDDDDEGNGGDDPEDKVDDGGNGGDNSKDEDKDDANTEEGRLTDSSRSRQRL